MTKSLKVEYRENETAEWKHAVRHDEKHPVLAEYADGRPAVAAAKKLAELEGVETRVMQEHSKFKVQERTVFSVVKVEEKSPIVAAPVEAAPVAEAAAIPEAPTAEHYAAAETHYAAADPAAA